MLPFDESQTLHLHIVLTAMMTGVIWVIQLVHYPSFQYVESSVYTKFQKFHMRSITYIVMPLMIGELLTAFLLLAYQTSMLYFLNLAGVVLIWLSTAVLSVPCHAKLEKAYSFEQAHKLVKTNWPRTILWSARLILLMSLSLN
jgi:DMSO reductase anchor subunit